MTTIHQDTFYTERLRLGKFYGTIYSSIWLAMQNQLDALVTISKQTHDTYQSYFKKDIHVIYNGVNCEEGKVDETLIKKISSFKKDGLVLLGTYALITKRKGLIQVLRMMEKYPTYKFIIIGNGPDVANLDIYVKEHNLQERVLFRNM